MSPEKWLAGLLAVIALSFVGSCLLLWNREASDAKQAKKEEDKRRIAAKAEFEATKARLRNRLETVRGANGRSNRTGAPINRRARGA